MPCLLLAWLLGAFEYILQTNELSKKGAKRWEEGKDTRYYVGIIAVTWPCRMARGADPSCQAMFVVASANAQNPDTSANLIVPLQTIEAGTQRTASVRELGAGTRLASAGRAQATGEAHQQDPGYFVHAATGSPCRNVHAHRVETPVRAN